MIDVIVRVRGRVDRRRCRCFMNSGPIIDLTDCSCAKTTHPWCMRWLILLTGGAIDSTSSSEVLTD